MIYSLRDANIVLFFFRKTMDNSAELVGSFGKGAIESRNDIDIHLPTIKKTARTITKLTRLLEPKPAKRKDGSFADNGITFTDWGGAYFHNTFFGDIDVFFKGSTEKFDY